MKKQSQSRGDVLRQQVLDQFVLSPAELALLNEAASTVDELGRLEAALAGSPVTVPGSKGQERAHPLLNEIRGHRRTLESLCRSLCLPVEGETVGRPRSPRHVASANERWRRPREAG